MAAATSAPPAPPADPVAVAEVERKFEPGPGFRLPDLARVPGVASAGEPVVHELDATYLDTADLRLARAKVTLRRRTGGDDAGWHLKRPRADGDRDELRVPLGESRSAVPAVLRRAVEVHARGAQLAPVVRLTTARTVRHLLDADGAVLAEVAQDEVRAAVPAADGSSATVQSWSELEVELVAGDRDLLDAVTRAVVDAGAPLSDSPSKLSRALGDRLPPKRPALPEGVPGGSAAAVLLAHLGDHVTRVTTNDPLVRADAPDAVHQLRVAARRLRSALATYRPLVDPAVTDPLRAELRWLGEVLGHARDAEVIRDELATLVAAQPPELVVGPVAGRVEATLGARYRAAHDDVLVALDGPRYFRLLDALDALLADPPLTPDARRPAGEVLPPLVARTFTRTRRLVRALHRAAAPGEGDAPDPRRHDELLHEVRKAAKRARYAGESLVATHGEDARRWAARMEAVQEALGAHQDSVVIRAELLALAEAARAAGEDTFTHGRLHALQEARGRATERDFERLWKAARARSARRWLEG